MGRGVGRVIIRFYRSPCPYVRWFLDQEPDERGHGEQPGGVCGAPGDRHEVHGLELRHAARENMRFTFNIIHNHASYL